MQAQAIPVAKKRKGFNPENAEHQKKVTDFATRYFGQLEDKSGKRNTIKFYGCCQVFISRHKVNHGHDESTCMLFSTLKARYDVKNQASFAAAMKAILKDCSDRGMAVFCPSFNTDHVELLEESEEEMEGQKQLIVQDDEAMSSLRQQLQEKDEEIARLKRENERVGLIAEQANFESLRVSRLHRKVTKEPSDFISELTIAQCGERVLQNLMYECEKCRSKLDPELVKGIEKRLEEFDQGIFTPLKNRLRTTFRKLRPT